jgi:hypothetical protein
MDIAFVTIWDCRARDARQLLGKRAFERASPQFAVFGINAARPGSDDLLANGVCEACGLPSMSV